MTYSFEPTSASQTREVRFRPDVPSRFEPEESDVTETTPETAEAEAAEKLVHLRAEAHEAGRAEGLAEAQALFEPAAQAFAAAASELSIQQHAYLQAQRSLLAKLAVAIAERVIGGVLDAHPDRIVDRVLEALTAIESGAAAEVELSPRDHRLVLESSDASIFTDTVTLTSNPNLSPGDVLVHSGSTTIDTRIASLLERAQRALRGLESVHESSEEGGEDES